MRKSKPTISYRRKRQSKTDYRKRLELLKSGLPRLIIRITSNDTLVQGIEYHPDGDRTIFLCNSRHLAKLGWAGCRKNMPAAYLTGLLCAKRFKDKEGRRFILDIAKSKLNKGNKLYAALKGVLDGGLDVIHSEDIVPSPERISGKHIAEYAKKIKDTEKYSRQFSSYIKQGFLPEDMQKHFEEIKQKIEKIS